MREPASCLKGLRGGSRRWRFGDRGEASGDTRAGRRGRYRGCLGRDRCTRNDERFGAPTVRSQPRLRLTAGRRDARRGRGGRLLVFFAPSLARSMTGGWEAVFRRLPGCGNAAVLTRAALRRPVRAPATMVRCRRQGSDEGRRAGQGRAHEARRQPAQQRFVQARDHPCILGRSTLPRAIPRGTDCSFGA